MALFGLFGRGNYGQLGNGQNEDSIEPVAVKINENTELTNVVKISAGTNHALALTKDRKSLCVGCKYLWTAWTK